MSSGTGPLPGPADDEVTESGAARAVASDARAAAGGGAVLVAGRLLIAALGWACSVIVARSLTEVEWGQFSFVFVLLGLLAVVTDLGVGRIVLARLIGDDPAEVTAHATAFVALRTLLGVLGYATAIVIVVALGYPSVVVQATAIGGLVVLFATPGQALTVLFQSRHQTMWITGAESAGQLLQLGLTVLAALAAPTLLIFMIPAVLNEVLALVVKMRGLRATTPRIHLSRRVQARLWAPMLREAIPLSVGFGLTIAVTKIDVLMLSRMDGFASVGMYSIGYKFSDILDLIALAVAGPVATMLVAAWPDRTAEFRRRARASALVLTVFGATAVAAFWPTARPVIELLYGDRFGPSAQAARLLVLASVGTALVVTGMFLLASCGMHRIYPVVPAVGLAVNIALNAVWIPRWSYEGAAAATVVTMALMAAGLWAVIARAVPIDRLLPLGPLAGLAAVTAAVVAAGTAFTEHSPVPWPVVAAVCAIAVPAAVFALRLNDGIDPRGLLRRDSEEVA